MLLRKLANLQIKKEASRIADIELVEAYLFAGQAYTEKGISKLPDNPLAIVSFEYLPIPSVTEIILTDGKGLYTFKLPELLSILREIEDMERIDIGYDEFTQQFWYTAKPYILATENFYTY